MAHIASFYLNFNDEFLQSALQHPLPDAFPYDLHHLQDFFSEQGLSLSFVASSQVRDASQLHRAFAQCQELYQYLFITGEHAILTPVTFHIEDCASTCSISKSKEQFLAALRSENEDDLAAALDAVFDEVRLCTYDLAKLVLNQLLLDFINCCNEILKEYDASITFEHLYTRLNSLASLQQTRQFFLDTGHTAIMRLKERQNSHFSAMILNIKHYVADHYDDSDLCISTFANYLHLTPGYVGKIFTRETGTSLPEYILSIRLRQATQKLTATNLLVSEISEHCGFSSRNYFASQFKKHYGMSPKDYRTRYAAGKQARA